MSVENSCGFLGDFFRTNDFAYLIGTQLGHVIAPLINGVNSDVERVCKLFCTVVKQLNCVRGFHEYAL